MTMSMDELQIIGSVILVVVIHMMDFQQTVGGEVPPAVDAYAVLPFEESGDAGGQEGIAACTGRPIEPIPIKGAPPVFHFDMTHDREVLMVQEHPAVWGLETPGLSPIGAEVSPLDPSCAFVRMPKCGPSPQFLMHLMIGCAEGFVDHAGPVILPPAADDRVEGFHDRFLRDSAKFAEGFLDRLQVRVKGLLARSDQRFEPRAILPDVAPHRILPDGESQEVKACWLGSCGMQGVAELRFGVFEFKADGGEPLRHILLGFLDDGEVFMQDDKVIRIADDGEGPPEALAAIAARVGPAVMGFEVVEQRCFRLVFEAV